MPQNLWAWANKKRENLINCNSLINNILYELQIQLYPACCRVKTQFLYDILLCNL